MLALWRVGAAARWVALIGFIGWCANGAASQSILPLQLATLVPAQEPLQSGLITRVGRGPFNLVTTHSGPTYARWLSLQTALQVEGRILKLCRSDTRFCRPETYRFLAIVDSVRDLTGRARVGAVNRAVNLAIRPMSDFARFHVPAVWTTPLVTFALGSGDCKDYAIAKYEALRASGVDADDLRLVILHDQVLNQDHAVAAARVDDRWLILNNKFMTLLEDSEIVNMTPLLSLDSSEGMQVIKNETVSQQVLRDAR